MQRPFLFGGEVELADGWCRLAGLEIDPESWTAGGAVLERGIGLKEDRKVPADHLTSQEEGHLRVAAAWRDLAPAGKHEPWAPLLSPSTRVHFVSRGALSRTSGWLAGALLGDDLQVRQFVVTLRGKLLSVSVEAAHLHAEQWLYIPAETYPPDSLPEYGAL